MQAIQEAAEAYLVGLFEDVPSPPSHCPALPSKGDPGPTAQNYSLPGTYSERIRADPSESKQSLLVPKEDGT